MCTAEEIEQLRSLLMEEWDSIGVHHFSDNEDWESYWDEYDSLYEAVG
jgi:ribulose bisphosphate carboxylase small subunit